MVDDNKRQFNNRDTPQDPFDSFESRKPVFLQDYLHNPLLRAAQQASSFRRSSGLSSIQDYFNSSALDAVQNSLRFPSSRNHDIIHDHFNNSALGAIHKAIELSSAHLRFGSVHDHLFSPAIKAFQNALHLPYEDRYKPIQDYLSLTNNSALQRAIQFADNNPMRKHHLDVFSNTLGRSPFIADELFKKTPLDREFIDAVQELGKSAVQSVAVNELVENLPDNSTQGRSISYHEYLSKLPQRSKRIFWILFLYLIWYPLEFLMLDVAVGVVSDNLKPMIKDYICNQPMASMKVVSLLVCKAPGGELRSTRIVKVHHLHVRKTPNAKGEIIDVLPKFEPVTLVTKNDNFSWSLIRYKNKDDEVIEGWVFSRYLHKPN